MDERIIPISVFDRRDAEASIAGVELLPIALVVRSGDPDLLDMWAGFVTLRGDDEDGWTEMGILFTPLESTGEPSEGVRFYAVIDRGISDVRELIMDDPGFLGELSSQIEREVFGFSGGSSARAPGALLNNPEEPAESEWFDHAASTTGDALVKSILYRFPGVGVGLLGALYASPLAMGVGAALSAVGGIYGLYAGGRENLEEFLLGERELNNYRRRTTKDIRRIARRSAAAGIAGLWGGRFLGSLVGPVAGGVMGIAGLAGLHWVATSRQLENYQEERDPLGLKEAREEKAAKKNPCFGLHVHDPIPVLRELGLLKSGAF